MKDIRSVSAAFVLLVVGLIAPATAQERIDCRATKAADMRNSRELLARGL